RRPSVVNPQHIERLEVKGLESDRKFLQMVVRLRELADDRTVGAVLLKIDDLDLGLGRIEELRALVEALRARKPVFAELAGPSTLDHYLASACDGVVVHPAAGVPLAGLSPSLLYYKGTLDKLGVNVDFVRSAEYKAAVEPYVMTGPSVPVRENLTAV